MSGKKQNFGKWFLFFHLTSKSKLDIYIATFTRYSKVPLDMWSDVSASFDLIKITFSNMRHIGILQSLIIFSDFPNV